ncbi:MAG: hypothetical protein KDB50_13285 [Mycobacterium sp.]|nr:hypothetical protein [Mycobacterium sp.]
MMLVAAWSAIALGTAGLGYRWRHRTLRLCAMVIVAAVAAVTALLLTGDVAARLVADAAKILVGTVILSILAVLLIVRALPRLSSRRDRGNVILICCALAGGYLFVAMFLTMAADQHLRVGQLPQLRTREEFLARRDGLEQLGGVLMEATISDRNPELRSGVVASISCPTIGGVRIPGTAHRLPDRYLLEFPGGPPVIAAGITSSLQAWRWPQDDDDGSSDCVLRRSTPVVVWGDVRKGMGGEMSTSQTGLADTQLIAVGDIASFLRDYVPIAQRTGRAVHALAVLNAALGAVMIAVGVATWRRLTHHGTDTPPRITWRSG